MNDFFQSLQKLSDALPGFAEDVLDEMAEIGTERGRKPDLFKGGELARSVHFTKNGQFARTVLTDKSYAGYLEFGNNQRGDKIYPHGKALRFEINGEVLFRKWVRSHGPYHFMGDARDEVIARASSIAEKHWRNLHASL